jgi:hypothetical protein
MEGGETRFSTLRLKKLDCVKETTGQINPVGAQIGGRILMVEQERRLEPTI